MNLNRTEQVVFIKNVSKNSRTTENSTLRLSLKLFHDDVRTKRQQTETSIKYILFSRSVPVEDILSGCHSVYVHSLRYHKCKLRATRMCYITLFFSLRLRQSLRTRAPYIVLVQAFTITIDGTLLLTLLQS